MAISTLSFQPQFPVRNLTFGTAPVAPSRPPVSADLVQQLVARQNLGVNLFGFAGAPLQVAVIDDFVAEKDGFNHGQEIASIIEESGARTQRFNIDRPGGDRTSLISSALDTLIAQVSRGQRVDAVNISQQDFQASATTARINRQVDLLESLGVPVVVAAGNEPGKVNELARTADIVVESSEAPSGKGNVKAPGSSTSRAAARVAPLAALAKVKGGAWQHAASVSGHCH